MGFGNWENPFQTLTEFKGRGGKKYRKIQDERNMDEDWHGVSIMRNDREVFFGYPHPWTGGLNLNQQRGRWVGFEINFSAII